MNHLACINRQRRSLRCGVFGRCGALATLVAVIVLGGFPAPTRASEACTVLLCLAGNWRSIDQCVPPVRRMLRNLFLGRSFPICAFAAAPSPELSSPLSNTNSLNTANSSVDPTSQTPTLPAGTQATLRWASGDFCPPQYRFLSDPERGNVYDCSFQGAIEVSIGGLLWNRTWWTLAGDSVTEWTAAARSAVPQAAADDRFDRDYAAWLEIQRLNAELQKQQTPTDVGGGG